MILKEGEQWSWSFGIREKCRIAGYYILAAMGGCGRHGHSDSVCASVCVFDLYE